MRKQRISKKDKEEAMIFWVKKEYSARIARCIAVAIAGEDWVEDVEEHLDDDLENEILDNFRSNEK